MLWCTLRIENKGALTLFLLFLSFQSNDLLHVLSSKLSKKELRRLNFHHLLSELWVRSSCPTHVVPPVPKLLALSSWDRFTEFQNPLAFPANALQEMSRKTTREKGNETRIFRRDLCEIPVAIALGISLWEFHIWIWVYMIYGSEMNLQNKIWSLKCRTICRSFTSQLACGLKLANCS